MKSSGNCVVCCGMALRDSGSECWIDSVAQPHSLQFDYEKVPKGLIWKYNYSEVSGPKRPVVLYDLTPSSSCLRPGSPIPLMPMTGSLKVMLA